MECALGGRGLLLPMQAWAPQWLRAMVSDYLVTMVPDRIHHYWSHAASVIPPFSWPRWRFLLPVYVRFWHDLLECEQALYEAEQVSYHHSSHLRDQRLQLRFCRWPLALAWEDCRPLLRCLIPANPLPKFSTDPFSRVVLVMSLAVICASLYSAPEHLERSVVCPY